MSNLQYTIIGSESGLASQPMISYIIYAYVSNSATISGITA